ncbi:MAG: hypothetical protein LH615_04200 [Ferruginibacter sp.]|nr:hypothetical protein [Ferruginibacter sp.]
MKKCRPINNAKNEFLKWLKKNKAECLSVFNGKDKDWDYYTCVSAFVKDNLYTVYFMMWQDTVKINYFDDENTHTNMDVDEFTSLL